MTEQNPFSLTSTLSRREMAAELESKYKSLKLDSVPTPLIQQLYLCFIQYEDATSDTYRSWYRNFMLKMPNRIDHVNRNADIPLFDSDSAMGLLSNEYSGVFSIGFDICTQLDRVSGIVGPDHPFSKLLAEGVDNCNMFEMRKALYIYTWIQDSRQVESLFRMISDRRVSQFDVNLIGSLDSGLLMRWTESSIFDFIDNEVPFEWMIASLDGLV